MNYTALYLKTSLYSNALMKSGGQSKKSIKPWILAAWLLSTTLGETSAMADKNPTQPVSIFQAGDWTNDVSQDFPYKLVKGTECAGGTCGIRADTGQRHLDETCPFCNSHLAKQEEEKTLRASQGDETEAAPSGTGGAGGGTPGGSGPDTGGPDDELSFEEVSPQNEKHLIKTAEHIKKPGLNAGKALVLSKDKVDGLGTRAPIPEAMSVNKGKPVSQAQALGTAVKHPLVPPPPPRDVSHGAGVYAPNGVSLTPGELVKAKNNLKKTDPSSSTAPDPTAHLNQSITSRNSLKSSTLSASNARNSPPSAVVNQGSEESPSLSGWVVHNLRLREELRNRIRNAHTDKGGTGLVDFAGQTFTIGGATTLLRELKNRELKNQGNTPRTEVPVSFVKDAKSPLGITHFAEHPTLQTNIGPLAGEGGSGTRAPIPEAMSVNKGKPVSQAQALGTAVKHPLVPPPPPRDVSHGAGVGVSLTPGELVKAKNNLKKTDPSSSTAPDPTAHLNQSITSRNSLKSSTLSASNARNSPPSAVVNQGSEESPSLSGWVVHNLRLREELRNRIRNAHTDKGGTGLVDFAGQTFTIGGATTLLRELKNRELKNQGNTPRTEVPVSFVKDAKSPLGITHFAEHPTLQTNIGPLAGEGGSGTQGLLPADLDPEITQDLYAQAGTFARGKEEAGAIQKRALKEVDVSLPRDVSYGPLPKVLGSMQSELPRHTVQADEFNTTEVNTLHESIKAIPKEGEFNSESAFKKSASEENESDGSNVTLVGSVLSNSRTLTTDLLGDRQNDFDGEDFEESNDQDTVDGFEIVDRERVRDVNEDDQGERSTIDARDSGANGDSDANDQSSTNDFDDYSESFGSMFGDAAKSAAESTSTNDGANGDSDANDQSSTNDFDDYSESFGSMFGGADESTSTNDGVSSGNNEPGATDDQGGPEGCPNTL